MAQRRQKDLFTRLADAGEEAIQRLAGTPGADRLVGVATNMRDQIDALSKRVRGMDDLERRVAKLERRLDELSKESARRTTTSRSRTTKTTATKRSTGSTSQRKKT
jgi:hypothetical protein